jgi:hypothetical protein
MAELRRLSEDPNRAPMVGGLYVDELGEDVSSALRIATAFPNLSGFQPSCKPTGSPDARVS